MANGTELLTAGLRPETAAEPGTGFFDVLLGGLENFLGNPNNQRFLGQIGSGVSQGQPIGQVLGGATGDLVRNRAFQQAAATRSQQENDLLGAIIKSLSGGQLLSPASDNNAFDSVTMTGDGNVTLKSSVAPSQDVFPNSLTDQPLDAQPRRSVTNPFS